jgi:pilus assembly protein CpaB
MMRRQSLIAIGIALVLGLFAVYLANIFLSNTEQRSKVAIAGTTRVAVAAVALDYGATLTPEKIRFSNFPRDSIPPGAFTSLASLMPNGKARIALRPMLPNEPILASKVTGEGQTASIAAVLPDGMRAAAVRVNDVSGVAGFIQPNDAVDVLITRQMANNAGNAANSKVTDVLLQGVRIIAIDQNAKNADGTPVLAKTATLEVTPVDAQKLALAQEVGQLSLVLRKPGLEQSNGGLATVSMRDLRYGNYSPARAIIGAAPVIRAAAPRVTVARRARPVPVPQRPANSVEVVRGTQGSKYEVGDYGS